MKRLACFFAYADPGESAANPRWEALGYRFVEEPVAPTQPVGRALVGFRAVKSTGLSSSGRSHRR